MTVGAIAALVLIGCSPGGSVQDALDRSTARLLVPTGQWRNDFEFTAPAGSTDLYEMRWNFRPGATDLVIGWQIASTSTAGAGAIETGPTREPAVEALAAATADDCEVVDPAAGIRLCSFPAEFARGGANFYLVRDLAAHADRTLVIEYLNIDGDRNEYNPQALEARFIQADFEAVPIDGNIDDYLV